MKKTLHNEFRRIMLSLVAPSIVKTNRDERAVVVENDQGRSRILLVCEHANNHIPERYKDLGLDAAAQQSHAAWDIGAKGLSQKLSKNLDATLVMSEVSRLVYDCNRPPTAHDAVPAKSELVAVPGNVQLSNDDKDERIKTVYEPFKSLLTDTIQTYREKPILITIHSFTPVYYGEVRDVEVGVIHDKDARLAEKMLETAAKSTELTISLNEPYTREDGVAHTLDLHATRNDLVNVMIEVRNDLITTELQQTTMAQVLTNVLKSSLTDMNEPLFLGGMI